MERERRGHARKRSSTGVTFRGPEGVPFHGLLVDISRGGCFVASPSTLAAGETIEIELRLSDVPAQVTGRVVWTRERAERERPAGIGVAFVDLPSDALAAIDKLGAEVRLSRPSTIIGIAPAPRASIPSYNPPPMPAEPEPQPAPEPVAAPPPGPKKKSRVPWVLGGLGAAAVLTTAVVLVSRHRHTPHEAASDAGEAVLAPEIQDASVAQEHDAGVPEDAQIPDAARPHKRPKAKPRRH